MTETQEFDYEHHPAGETMDETDVSLRYHLTKLSDEKLREYDAKWSDEQLVEWDDNFRSDGNLMLVCVERDIDVEEYRRVLEQHIEARRMNGAEI